MTNKLPEGWVEEPQPSVYRRRDGIVVRFAPEINQWCGRFRYIPVLQLDDQFSAMQALNEKYPLEVPDGE